MAATVAGIPQSLGILYQTTSQSFKAHSRLTEFALQNKLLERMSRTVP
jgi:hypothetical protein